MLPKFLALFLVGFSMIFAGVIILVIATVLSEGSADFGAVIFIGPFPIVVGAGPDAEWMVLFAVILSVLSIIVFFLLRGEVERVKVQS
jgi:uncharacterized membrane protein